MMKHHEFLAVLGSVILLAACVEAQDPLDARGDAPASTDGKADEFDDGDLIDHPARAEADPTRDGDPERDLCEDDGAYDDDGCTPSCDRQDPQCPPRQWSRDIATTALSIDVEAARATATINFEETTLRGASLRVDEMDILEITDPQGEPLDFRVEDYGVTSDLDHDDLGDILFVPEAVDSLTVSYLPRTDPYDDWAFGRTTLAWPTNCAKMFPCNPQPADGTQFAIELTGLAEGQVAVFPETIPAEAPSYMAAWAIGEYSHRELGTTAAGTTVNVWSLPGSEQAAAEGTEKLVEAFDWLEQSLGSYLYGDSVGSVEAQWGPGGLGGMEHHPFWHVASGSMGDRTTHVHEAVHGWFGDGIRIECWEDFVLSEGVTTYLTARIIGEVYGDEAEAEVWDDYRGGSYRWGRKNAWIPEACELETVYRTDLWSLAPYRRGAFFLRALAGEVGEETLDAALGSFYQDHAGNAARFSDLLDHIEAETSFDPGPLAHDWLIGELPSLD